ncbi:hypothetical protein [Streptomyces cyaneogriseus]|uniref:hypothetical protein n=1 Tax=Streptomyces cyaneogriseus TaxID=68192 RepID=UPI000AD84183|nr:hypothetical protein [Streptomyces cyaneogriseus]
MEPQKQASESPAPADVPARPVRGEGRPAQGEGCLVVAIRIPVRIVTLVLVVPVRMVWDALVVGARFLNGTVLRPAGRALLWLGRAVFVWPFVGLWRYVAVPVGKGLAWLGKVCVVVPAGWLYRWVLTPVGHGFGWVYRRVLTPVGHAVVWVLRGVGAGIVLVVGAVYHVLGVLARYLVAVPALWLYRWVLTPLGHALAWCGRGLAWCARMAVTGVGTALYWTGRVLFVLPVLALWRWVLAPVGRVLAVVGAEVWAALGHAWRVAGHISLAVGRALGRLLRLVLVEPVRWVYRTVLTPVGHAVRDTVLRPAAEAARGAGRAVRQALGSARAAARQARADVRRMLFGERVPARDVDRREPSGTEGRTLGSSTTALTKD